MTERLPMLYTVLMPETPPLGCMNANQPITNAANMRKIPIDYWLP